MKFAEKISENYRNLNKIAFTEKQRFKILILLITINCILRIIIIDIPKIDRTHWKEIDYITISKNYRINNFNILRPEVSWPAEEPRVTAMEFPVVPYITALIYTAVDINSLSVRLVTVLSSVLLIIFLYKLVIKESGDLAGLISGGAAIFIPIIHPFSNYLFSEPLMISSMAGVLYYGKMLTETEKSYYKIALITALTLTIALKPTSLMIIIPLIYIYYSNYGRDIKKYVSLLKIIFLSLIIPVLWYAYAYYVTLTYIDVFGIFAGHNKFQTLEMLSSSEWYKIMGKRIIYEVVGGIGGIVIAGTGIAAAIVLKKGGVFIFYTVGVLIFFIIVAEGNLDANYRQMSLLPTVIYFISIGILFSAALVTTIMQFFFKFIRTNDFCVPLFVIILLFLGVVTLPAIIKIYNAGRNKAVHTDSWIMANNIKKYKGTRNKIVSAGEYSIHKGGNDLSPVLYYYTDSKGWNLGKEDWKLRTIDSLRKKGANLFTAFRMYREPESSQFLNKMKSRYPILYEDSVKGLLLLDLEKVRN